MHSKRWDDGWKDLEVKDKLIDEVLNLITEEERLKELEKNVTKFAMPDAAAHIVDEILKLV